MRVVKIIEDNIITKPLNQNRMEELEKAAERYASDKLKRPITVYQPLGANVAEYVGFIAGANYQAEKMYSEEDLHNAFYNGWLYRGENYSFPKAKKEWLDELKKRKILTFKSEE